MEGSLRAGALGHERGVDCGDEEEKGSETGGKDDHDESECLG